MQHSWDEWVSEDRVLKYTDDNIQKQRQLKETNSKRKSSRTSSIPNNSINDNTTTESRSRKRHRDSSIDKARQVGLIFVCFMYRVVTQSQLGRGYQKTRIQIIDTRYIKKFISGRLGECYKK